MKKYITFTSRTAIAAIVTAGLYLVSTAKAADETKSSSETKKSSLSANDKKFVKKAYKGGLAEIEHAKMAKEKAKNDATKEVAEHMLTDHGKANDELMKIAKEENLDLSKVHAPKPMHASDADFDKDYLTMLKKDHEKDIADFEKEANDTSSGEDSDVKAFAKKTLPTLKDHLKMVEDALVKVK